MPKQRKSKRQHKKVPRKDLVVSTANQVLADIRLDIIGFDSCILATKLLHDRLAAINIASKPVDCITIATVDVEDGQQLIASLSEGDKPGHAVLFSEGLLIDLTVNQFSELDGRIPEVSPIAAALPDIDEPTFSIELNPPGVRLEYIFDINRTPFFFDSYDWRNPDIEASVQETLALIAEGYGNEIKKMVRQRQQQPRKN